MRGSDGTILAQSGGLTATCTAGGNYFVAFPASVAGKLIIAAPQWQGSDLDRTVQAALCGGDGTTGAAVSCTAGNDASHVYVETWQSAAETDVNFYIGATG